MKNKMNKKDLNKKGISTVIATVLMIAIVIVIVGIVWISISGLIGQQIESSESCFGNFGKVTLDKRYTCYNPSSNELQFSINVGDIVLDSVLVSVSSQSGAKSFEIENTTISDVKRYGGVYGEIIEIPEKNAGVTYVVNVSGLGITNPDSISIAPIINKNQCEVSDSLSNIGVC